MFIWLRTICITKNCKLYRKGMYASLKSQSKIDKYYLEVLLMYGDIENVILYLDKIYVTKDNIFKSIFGKILAYDLSYIDKYKKFIAVYPELKRYTYLQQENKSYFNMYDFLDIELNLKYHLRKSCGPFSIKKINNKILYTSCKVPFLSIVMTAYNEEKYISTAIQSLRAQTFSNFELIIINDASEDNTAFIIDSFAKRDQRIKTVHLKQNGGLWKAKNIGFNYCTANVITMHDADDWSDPNKIEKQYKALISKKSIRLTTSYLVRVEESSGKAYTRDLNSFVRWNPSSLMFYKNMLKNIGNFFTDILGSDCEFIARAELYYGKYAHVKLKSPMCIAMNREGSLSNLYRDDTSNKRIVDWEKWHVFHANIKIWHSFKDKELDQINQKGIK